MAKVNLSHGETWDLIYVLKSIVAQSEYHENIDLYCLKGDALMAHSRDDWEQLKNIILKLEDASGIRIDIGKSFN